MYCFALGWHGQLRSYREHHNAALEFARGLLSQFQVVVAWNVSLDYSVAAWKKQEKLFLKSMKGKLMNKEDFQLIIRDWNATEWFRRSYFKLRCDATMPDFRPDKLEVYVVHFFYLSFVQNVRDKYCGGKPALACYCGLQCPLPRW